MKYTGKYFLTYLIKPSDSIKTPEMVFKVKALQFLILSYMIVTGAGILAAPLNIRPPLAMGFPFIMAGYLISRTKHFALGGWLNILATYVICSFIILKYDKTGEFVFLSLSWITITIFMAIIWMSFRHMVFVILLQVIYSFVITILSPRITASIFSSWFFLNVFFVITNLSTGWILNQYQKMTVRNREELEDKIEKKTSDLSTALSEKDLLLKELYHRTKNNMQVISSMLKLQAAYADNREISKICLEVQTRITTMAMVHEKLYTSPDLRCIETKDYLSDLAGEIHRMYLHQSESVSLEINISPSRLSLEQAIPLGLVLHEILTNSFKYALEPGTPLKITISCHIENKNTLILAVEDTGQGFCTDFDPRTQASLGMTLILNIVEKQLNGSIDFSKPPGCIITVEIPYISQDD